MAREAPSGPLVRSARDLRLALALYLPSLVLGTVSSALVFVAGTALDRTGDWTREIAAGNGANVALELATSTAGRMAAGESPTAELRTATLGVLAAVLPLPFALVLHGLAYTFVSGGVLSRIVDRDLGFWRACRRWFWPMLRYGLLVCVAFLVLAALGLVAMVLLPERSVQQVPARSIAALAWLTLVNGVLEVGRADMVVRDDRRALRSLGRAFALPRHPRVFGWALAAWLGLGMLGALLWALQGVSFVVVPGLAVVPSLLVQQALALSGGWLKVVRLGVAASVAGAAATASSVPVVEGARTDRDEDTPRPRTPTALE